MSDERISIRNPFLRRSYQYTPGRLTEGVHHNAGESFKTAILLVRSINDNSNINSRLSLQGSSSEKRREKG